MVLNFTFENVLYCGAGVSRQMRDRQAGRHQTATTTGRTASPVGVRRGCCISWCFVEHLEPLWCLSCVRQEPWRVLGRGGMWQSDLRLTRIPVLLGFSNNGASYLVHAFTGNQKRLQHICVLRLGMCLGGQAEHHEPTGCESMGVPSTYRHWAKCFPKCILKILAHFKFLDL